MSKKPTIIQEPENLTESLTAHVSRFSLFHGLVCKSVLEIKIAKYFAGLEVNALYDLHKELHGETRGGDHRATEEESKTEGPSVLKLEDFLEEHLHVTARTARKYRDHFLSIVSEAPKIAEKLNGTWKQMALGEGQQVDAESLSVTSLQSASILNAEAMQIICDHADEWGLNELFETPQRNVTPSEDDEDDHGQDKKAKRAALLKFWTEALVKRLDQDEMHRLPVPALEAVINKMEEATKKGRELLAAKAAKKGARK